MKQNRPFQTTISSYCYWQEQAEEFWARDGEEAASDLAESLKASHEEALPKLEGFASDLMNAALSEVDWHEIAESLLNDAKDALGETVVAK